MTCLYPIFTDLRDKAVIVVGGGRIAERKIDVLHRAGAAVTVISPEVTDTIKAWEAGTEIRHVKRVYRPGDLADAWLVIAATDDQAINQAVYDEAEERRIFCNVVDIPSLCRFQVPSVLRRGSLQIAISTGGASPALARRIREKLERDFDGSYEPFLEILNEFREHLKEKYPENQRKRAEILEAFLESPAQEYIRRGSEKKLQELLEEWQGR